MLCLTKLKRFDIEIFCFVQLLTSLFLDADQLQKLVWAEFFFNLFSNKNEYIFLFPYSWKPFDIPTEKTDWVDGLRTVAGGSIEIID